MLPTFVSPEEDWIISVMSRHLFYFSITTVCFIQVQLFSCVSVPPTNSATGFGSVTGSFWKKESIMHKLREQTING